MKLAFCLRCGGVLGNFPDTEREIPPLCMTCQEQEPITHPKWHHPRKRRKIVAHFETIIPLDADQSSTMDNEPWSSLKNLRAIERKSIDDLTQFQDHIIERR
jgi:hypothetical protein